MPGRFLACPSRCREAALAASHEYLTPMPARRASALGASFTEAGAGAGRRAPATGERHHGL